MNNLFHLRTRVVTEDGYTGQITKVINDHLFMVKLDSGGTFRYHVDQLRVEK